MGWRASDGQNGVCMRFDELILPRLSASATSGYYVILQNSTAPAIPQLRLAQNNYPTHFCIFLRAITFPVPLSLFRVSTAHSILQLSSCLIPPYRCHTSLPSRHIKAHALRPDYSSDGSDQGTSSKHQMEVKLNITSPTGSISTATLPAVLASPTSDSLDEHQDPSDLTFARPSTSIESAPMTRTQDYAYQDNDSSEATVTTPKPTNTRHRSDSTATNDGAEAVDSIFRLLPRESRPALRRMMVVEPTQRCTLQDLILGRGQADGILCGCAGTHTIKTFRKNHRTILR